MRGPCVIFPQSESCGSHLIAFNGIAIHYSHIFLTKLCRYICSSYSLVSSCRHSKIKKNIKYLCKYLLLFYINLKQSLAIKETLNDLGWQRTAEDTLCNPSEYMPWVTTLTHQNQIMTWAICSALRDGIARLRRIMES